MITYTYKCPKCLIEFERQESISDDRLKICPECSNLLNVVIHNTPLVLRGGGWFKDGYTKNSEASC